jgi:hypothetical protein
VACPVNYDSVRGDSPYNSAEKSIYAVLTPASVNLPIFPLVVVSEIVTANRQLFVFEDAASLAIADTECAVPPVRILKLPELPTSGEIRIVTGKDINTPHSVVL